MVYCGILLAGWIISWGGTFLQLHSESKYFFSLSECFVHHKQCLLILLHITLAFNVVFGLRYMTFFAISECNLYLQDEQPQNDIFKKNNTQNDIFI